jgi:hypothetical protein
MDDAAAIEGLFGLPPLVVGTRVRVRLSGECTLCQAVRGESHAGLCGVVTAFEAAGGPTRGYPEHAYRVCWDAPRLLRTPGRARRVRYSGAYYARWELEREA